ncbi:MAG: NUDIX hydrolase [Desulfovibrionaceae bacterium]|nr:NUDIX hydrolase [Desulfovibrionaceae bacterium]
MFKEVRCPKCGQTYQVYANPTPTADVIIYEPEYGVVFVERRNIPLGYALPGGFIDEGEMAETAAKREMLEETGLEVELIGLLGVYSNPKRDPRLHTLTTVYVGRAKDVSKLQAGDDAKSAAFYALDALPTPLVFDHAKIMEDFCAYLDGQRFLAGLSGEVD